MGATEGVCRKYLWWESCVWRMAEETAEKRRTCVCKCFVFRLQRQRERGWRRMETFSFPIYVTSKAFVSQQNVSNEKKKDNIHIIISRVPLPTNDESFLLSSFLLDNDSDTEIKGKANFLRPSLAHIRTHVARSQNASQILENIWNNKNIRCLILISSYFSLRNGRGGMGGEAKGGTRWISTFCQCVHFSFCFSLCEVEWSESGISTFLCS